MIDYNLMLEKRKRAKLKSFQKHLNRQKAKPEYVKRELLNTVRMSNRNLNMFKYAPNNTKAHEITKFLVYMTLRDMGHDVLVEAIFENGQRADIVDLDGERIIEILASETEAMLEKKTTSYPQCFELVRVDANQEFKEEMLL